LTKKEVFSEKRINKIVDYIIAYHNQKPLKEVFSTFGSSSIDNVMQYYDLFQQKEAGEHDLRIATIFTYGSNEDSDEAQDFLPDDFNDVSIAAEPQTIYNQTHQRQTRRGT
jgi:type I restriction enzyme R subunit